MAKSSILSVTVLANIAKLEKGMKGAKGALKDLEKSTKSISKGMNAALGAIGAGLSVAGLVNLSKAASDDAKSAALMANAIQNATGATDAATKSAEAYVQTLSNQLGVSDDQLRPALQTLTQATGDLTLAQQMLPLAMDIAADSGISAETAADALAKAHNGNTKALYKLYPALKNSATPMADLQKLTAGAAEEAANSDPWMKLSVIMENLTETLGSYLLPYIDALSTALQSDMGQKAMGGLATIFQTIFNTIFNLFTFLADNSWILNTVIALVVMTKTFFAIYQIVKKVYSAMKGLTIAQLIAKSIQTMVGPAALVAAAAAAIAGVGLFMGLDMLMGDGGEVAIPEVPEATVVPIPEIKKPDTTADKPAGGSPTDRAKKALESGIKTLQAELKKAQETITKMAEKFANAVSLSFGVIERGTRKIFNADKVLKEMKRIEAATVNYKANLEKLRAIGGKDATGLIQQIMGMDAEEAAAAAQAYVNNSAAFMETIQVSKRLGQTGAAVGAFQNDLEGRETPKQILNEIKLLREQLAKGKNQYNIKSEMTATEIVNSIKKWERSTGRKVLI